MKKLFLTYALAAISSLGLCAATPDVDADINDWGYVEDGMIYAKVVVENAGGISVTLPDDETPITLADGMNVVKVPLTVHAITVKATGDYKTVSIKVGDTSLEADDTPVTVDCTKPATIYLSAQGVTSFIGPTIFDAEASPRYFAPNGAEVHTPQAGHPYICICGKTITKIIWRD